MTDNEKRRRWRKYSRMHAHIAAAWAARGYQYPPPRYPAMPDDLAQLACGAKTRAGTPCKLTALHACGRCKLHGGKSTGPKSEAGRRQAAENGKKGGRPRAENPTP
jgi:hypothetical protein